jgi:hypothetical protein
MPERKSGNRAADSERYKNAATDALTLLDWCIEYLRDNRQGKLADQLARNRAHIRARLGYKSTD